MAAIRSLFANLVHLLGVSNFGYIIYFLLVEVDFSGSNKQVIKRIEEGKSRLFNFLTFWNLWVQVAFFSISLLAGLFSDGKYNYLPLSLTPLRRGVRGKTPPAP